MSELVLGSLADRKEYATTIQSASLLPPAYRGKPADIMIAMEYARDLGESIISVMTDIHVINGVPSMSAKKMHSRALKAGHRVRVTFDGVTQTARAVLVRHDDPTYEHVAVWDMERATKAGLAGGANWKKNPPAMLKARAVSEVVRQAAPDCLSGIVYTPEELDSKFVDGGFEGGSEPARVTLQRGKVAEPVAPPAVAEPVVTVTPSDSVSDVQLRRLHALRNEKGLTRESFLAGASSALGRAVESSKTLTKDEAKHLIDRISAMPTPEPEPDAVTGEM